MNRSADKSDRRSYKLEHQQIFTNGIRLHVVQAGPADGPLLILLHGFPEFWYGWRQQIPFLAAAGYRVWAPDQRGYNLSDKPVGLAAYNLDILAVDVVGLIEAAGREQAILIGHDWGGAVAWHVAANYPQRLRSLVILNSPHGSAFRRSLRRGWAQRRKSWYMFAFQIPWLPEFFLKRNNWRLAASSFAGIFTASDVEKYRQAWSQPRAMTSMLNWYRALYRQPPAPPAKPPVTMPTLIIWGARDKFFAQDLAAQSVALCAHGRLHLLDDATHWVQHQAADRVNALIKSFLEEEQ